MEKKNIVETLKTCWQDLALLLDCKHEKITEGK